MRVLLRRVIAAETAKQSALGETVFGIRTVKSLALEPQRKALWDERVAEVRQLAALPSAGWPTGRRRWSRRSSGSCGWASS